MLRKIINVLFVSLILVSANTYANNSTRAISASRAANYMGQKVLACGKLAEVKHVKNRHFLNLDAPYPHQSLSILVWKNDYQSISDKLNYPEANIGKVVCAFGKVQEYKRSVQIIVKKPQNIDYAK